MIVVAALYQFLEIEEGEAHRTVRLMRDVMREYDVRGNVRVAKEGLNGTISGSRDGVKKFLDVVKGVRAKRGTSLSTRKPWQRHMYMKRQL